MAFHHRQFWGLQKTNIYTFRWNVIRENSFVLITASEGSRNAAGPANRFVGSAHFQVSSIAPFNGGVSFWVIIGDAKAITTGFFNWWIDPLPVWTDITVF
jgi:hypothetical protein